MIARERLKEKKKYSNKFAKNLIYHFLYIPFDAKILASPFASFRSVCSSGPAPNSFFVYVPAIFNWDFSKQNQTGSTWWNLLLMIIYSRITDCYCLSKILREFFFFFIAVNFKLWADQVTKTNHSGVFFFSWNYSLKSINYGFDIE